MSHLSLVPSVEPEPAAPSNEKAIAISGALAGIRAAAMLLDHFGFPDQAELADLLASDVMNAAIEQGVRPVSAEIGEERARFRASCAEVANQIAEAKL